MARKTTSPADSSSPLTVTITQQALNLLRQIVTAIGWAKTIAQIYIGGKLLAETLPVLESVAWVKTEKEVTAMTDEQRKAYMETDKAWGEKPYTFTVTSDERDAIEAAFNHFARTAASAKRLGPNEHLYALICAFSIKDTPDGAEVKDAKEMGQ